MTDHRTKTTGRYSSAVIERVRFWWRASTEIHELTRDHALEEHVIAEAATRLAPGPANIAWLFRHGPARSDVQHPRTNSTPTTSN